MPATPTPLSAVAPMIPATWVPWPALSVVSVVLVTVLKPATTRPPRSGWLACTPVSTTPTVTPAPVDFVHACSASMSASTRPLVPGLNMPQSCGQYGSFVSAWTRSSVSA